MPRRRPPSRDSESQWTLASALAADARESSPDTSESSQEPNLPTWSTLGDDERVAETDTVTRLSTDGGAVEAAVYETRVDDRPVTARLVGGVPGTDDPPVTVVETPLRTVRHGDGLVLDAPGTVADVDWLPASAGGVYETLVSVGGHVVVDDRLAVVRYETEGTVDDADGLVALATAAAGVADAVEARDGPADRERTVTDGD